MIFFNLTFEMRRPGILHQQPHHKSGSNREAGLVKQPYGNEAENEWMSTAPEPPVLMQYIQKDDDNYQ